MLICIVIDTSLRGRRLKGRGKGVKGKGKGVSLVPKTPFPKTPFPFPFKTPATQAKLTLVMGTTIGFNFQIINSFNRILQGTFDLSWL